MLLFNLKKRPVRITYFSGFSLLYFLKKRGDYKNLISINQNLINQEDLIPNQIIQEEVNPNLIAEIKINQEESVKKEVTYNITEEEIKCKQKWICLFDLVIMDYSSKKQLELELSSKINLCQTCLLKQITKQSFILCNKCSVIFCNSQQEFVVLDFLNNQYQIKYEEFLNSYKRHITKEPEILLRKLVRENKEILKEITSHLFSTKRKKINYSQVFSKIIDEIDVFLKNGVTENFEDKAKNFFININNIFIEKNYIINLFEQCQKSISYKYRILNNKDEDQTKINSRINEYRKDQLDILKYIEVHLLKHIEENLKFYQNKDNHLKIILNNILIYLNLENSIENFRLLQFWAKSKEKKEGQRIRIDLIFNIIFQY